jgi:hypothetical protein
VGRGALRPCNLRVQHAFDEPCEAAAGGLPSAASTAAPRPLGGVLCAAHPHVPAQNSRRELRSLRSYSCAQMVDEARCARGREGWPCRPRRSLRLGRWQGTNGPPDRLCPCSPCRHRIGAADADGSPTTALPTQPRRAGASATDGTLSGVGCPPGVICGATGSAGLKSARSVDRHSMSPWWAPHAATRKRSSSNSTVGFLSNSATRPPGAVRLIANRPQVNTATTW